MYIDIFFTLLHCLNVGNHKCKQNVILCLKACQCIMYDYLYMHTYLWFVFQLLNRFGE